MKDKVLLEYYDLIDGEYEFLYSEYCKDYEDAVGKWLASEHKYYAIWKVEEMNHHEV